MKHLYFIYIAILLTTFLATPSAAQQQAERPHTIPQAAAAADQILMRIDGIDGNVTMAGYRGWIDVSSYMHNIQNTYLPGPGGGTGSGKPDHAPVVFKKVLDPATPPLVGSLNAGKVHKEATFDFIVLEANKPFVFFKVELREVIVTGYAIEASSGQEVVSEELALVYSWIRMTYCDSSVNGPKGCTSTTYNVATNMPASLAALSGPQLNPSDDAVAFTWEMASQDGIYGFEIQQWKDGGFRRAAYVPGAGWSRTEQAYSAAVGGLEQGIQVFRLALLGVDGSEAYSQEMRLAVGVESEEVAVGAPFPNPFVYGTTLPIAVDRSQQARVTAFDILGREVAVLFDGVVEPGREYLVQFLPTGDLASGMYALQVRTEQRTTTRLVTLRR